jgi:hypothetical protein
MQYFSLIRLIRHVNGNWANPSDKHLIRIKRALLTELQLDQKGYLLIDKIKYTQDDIISTIDQTRINQNINQHLVIFENRTLLNILESGNLEGSLTVIKYDSDFIHFVSPFLCPILSKTVHQAFLKRDFKLALYAQSYLVLLHNSFLDQVLSKIRVDMDDLIHVFEALTAKSYDLEPKRYNYIDSYFIEFVNLMPTFEEQRDRFASALINLTSKVENRHEEFCFRIYKELIHLKCTSQISDTIFINFNVFKRRYISPFKRYVSLAKKAVLLLLIITIPAYYLTLLNNNLKFNSSKKETIRLKRLKSKTQFDSIKKLNQNKGSKMSH